MLVSFRPVVGVALAISTASSSSQSTATVFCAAFTDSTVHAHPAMLRIAAHWCENRRSHSRWLRHAPLRVATSATRKGIPGDTSSAHSHGAPLLQHPSVIPTHSAAACCSGCRPCHSPIDQAPLRVRARPAASTRCLHQASQASAAFGSSHFPPVPATFSSAFPAAARSVAESSSQLCNHEEKCEQSG